MSADTPFTVRDNPEAGRFEAWIDGEMAFVSYRPLGDALAITYTEVPAAFAGRGIGSRLLREVLGQIRERGLKVIPMCGFTASYIHRHPEFHDMLDPGPTHTHDAPDGESRA